LIHRHNCDDLPGFQFAILSSKRRNKHKHDKLNLAQDSKVFITKNQRKETLRKLSSYLHSQETKTS
jgi:hypothetical protein